VGDDPQLIVRYARDDRFDSTRWWRNTRDGADVVREWLGIANAWLGFVAQPTRNQTHARASEQSR
jgi:hypothetical protein